jgi:hypothetical protein
VYLFPKRIREAAKGPDDYDWYKEATGGSQISYSEFEDSFCELTSVYSRDEAFEKPLGRAYAVLSSSCRLMDSIVARLQDARQVVGAGMIAVPQSMQ